MDALGLVNLSLMRIGERAVSALDADSTAARVASSYFRHSVDEVTTEHAWSFAKQRVQMTADETATNLTEYEFAYQLPSDALRVLSMVEDAQYIIESGYLFSNQEAPTLVYLKTLVTDGDTGAGDPLYILQPDLPAKFLEAVACRLGMKIATKIRGTDNMIIPALSQEYGVLLRQAMGNDSMDSPGKEDEVTWWFEV